jgi:hypothetical protein
MSYRNECERLAELKGTVVNIAFKAVRETELLDSVMRVTGVPPTCMEKDCV